LATFLEIAIHSPGLPINLAANAFAGGEK